MTKFFVLTCQIDAEQALPLVQANTNIILDPAIQVTISADKSIRKLEVKSIITQLQKP